MNAPYTSPENDLTSFNCPFCQAFSSFQWSTVGVNSPTGYTNPLNIKAAQCQHCKKWTLWVSEPEKPKGIGSKTRPQRDFWHMVYPQILSAPMPSKDMPKACREDYMEARKILTNSPRGASALLRLCIQRLCKELGGKGKDLDADIASFVKNGLHKRIQQGLDIVRVTGNHAVHPGVMNIDDNPEIVEKLFKLTNMIVEDMISKNDELNEIFGTLPEGAQEAIVKRDSGS